MSVKIEILDYKYGDSPSIVNVNAGNPQTGWTSLSFKGANFTGNGTNNVKYYENISTSIIVGKEYKIRLQITNYSGVGNIGFSQSDSNNTALGISSNARINSNGIVSETFIAAASGKIRVFGTGLITNADMKNISVIDTNGIDWVNSVVGELDVTDHTDFPIALTFQISDFKDLTSTSGDYSKSFKIPATKNNNNILKHLYIPNINVDNQVTEKKPCRLLFNNLYSLVGLIQVDSVGGYGETPSYYNCVFFGSNLSWADKIQDTYMNTIDWGADGEALTYNKDSITATWQHEDCNNSSNSPIVYPITSYGDYNPDGTARTIQLLDTLGEHNTSLGSSYTGYYGFYDDGNNYETPNPVADWRPSVFVKPTLDKIFSQLGGGFGTLGYKINSAFMETDMFKKLVWLLPNFKYNDPDQREIDYSVLSKFENGVSMTATGAGASDVTEDGIQRFFEGALEEDDGNYFYTGGGRQVLNIQSANLTVTRDESSYVDFPNNTVIIGENGYYNISINGLESRVARVYKGGGDDVKVNDIDTRINLEVKTKGQNSFKIVDFASNQHTINQDVDSNTPASSNYRDLPNISLRRYFNKGDEIRISLGIRLFCQQRTFQEFITFVFFKSNSSSNFNVELDPFNVEYGQTYDLNEVISSDYKQIDFVKGIAHAFNLKMTTDESTRTVNIEPFDTFYKPYGDALDWTYKLNRSKETKDKWLQSDLKRTLVFKYKTDDKDIRVESRSTLFHEIKDEYPYREELPDTFKKGTSEFENPFFAGSYNAKDQDTVETAPLDTAYSACLWTENVSPNDEARPNKGYDFLPRLLYWNKYSPATSIGTKKAIVQTWSNTTETITANASEALALSNIYPQATMVNRDSILSPNLAYGNVWVRDYDDDTGAYTSYQSGKGLYDTYYRNMIEGLKRKPTLRTVSLSLNITDIVNLDFTKLVYIDGVYWRISKIIDYKPNKNEPTKVELIEWFQVGVFAATAPMFGQGGDSSWSQDGSANDDSNNNMGL